MILLLDDTNAWSFYLVLLFLNVIPTLLKELAISRLYKLPRFSSLTTKVLQQQELEVMYESTVSAQRSMEEENKRIKAMVTSFAPHRKSTHNFYLSSKYFLPQPLSPPYFPHSPNMQTTKSSSEDTHLLHYGPGSIAEQIVFTHKEIRIR